MSSRSAFTYNSVPGILAEVNNSYWLVLNESVIPGIEAKRIPGYRGFEVFRRELEDEVEFVTVITFDSLQSVISFQGEDYARAYVPDEARAVLSRWDLTCAHYSVLK